MDHSGFHGTSSPRFYGGPVMHRFQPLVCPEISFSFKPILVTLLTVTAFGTWNLIGTDYLFNLYKIIMSFSESRVDLIEASVSFRRINRNAMQ